MKKTTILLAAFASLVCVGCSCNKDDRDAMKKEEKKSGGCGCSSENILDLRSGTTENLGESISPPSAKL
jgi:hypothetical protein